MLINFSPYYNQPINKIDIIHNNQKSPRCHKSTQNPKDKLVECLRLRPNINYDLQASEQSGAFCFTRYSALLQPINKIYTTHMLQNWHRN